MSYWDSALRLIVAALLGGIIGYERETAGKPAGLRTQLLVSMASALYVVSSQYAAEMAGEMLDPVRAMTGVAGGVGFLGGGVILKARREIHWLTTAAALWASAAVGMCAGFGLYALGATATVLIFVTLHWLPALSDYLGAHPEPRVPKDKKKNGASPRPPDPDKS